MIQLALDPSETRPTRAPDAPPARKRGLRTVLFGVVGLGAFGGICVAASTLMAGLASPTPARLAPMSRAADWPELKDGLPVLASTVAPAPAASMAVEPEVPTPRMAALPEAITALPTPAKVTTAPPPAMIAAVPEAPAKRIPTPVAVAPIGPSRQVVPLPPARTAALQMPRPSETVRARDPAQSAAAPAAKPASAVKAAAAPSEKAAPKAMTARKVATAKPAENGKVGGASATVAQAEPPDLDETEVLGIKLPSLAPAGRKLRESVDAFGEAVKKVF